MSSDLRDAPPTAPGEGRPSALRRDPLSLTPGELRQAARVAQLVGETLVRAATHTLKNVLNPLALQAELLRRRMATDDEHVRAQGVLSSMRASIDEGNEALEVLRTQAESSLRLSTPRQVDVARAMELALAAATLPAEEPIPEMGPHGAAQPPAIEREIQTGLSLQVDGVSLLVALFEIFEASLRRRPQRLRLQLRARPRGGVTIEVRHDGDRDPLTNAGHLRAQAIAQALAQIQRGSLTFEDHPDAGALMLELPDRDV